MTASDIATMLTNFRNLRIQDIKQFGKMHIASYPGLPMLEGLDTRLRCTH